MAVGFDYGTANCSVSEFINSEIIQVPLTKDGCYLPSTLLAPNTESVSEYLFEYKEDKRLSKLEKYISEPDNADPKTLKIAKEQREHTILKFLLVGFMQKKS
ncbi:hypothetical protein ACN3E9_00680 [Vibrio pectenicida]|uniref:hypothetical protein n=1 Tax=Vibrio pectenicida TaxID=62763 RepID=UPI003B990025